MKIADSLKRLFGARSADAQATGGDGPTETERLQRSLDATSAALKMKTAALEQACQLANLGTWTIRSDMRSVRASSHIRAILGLPHEVVHLDALREQILPDDRAEFDAALARAVQERRMAEVEFRAHDAQGEVRIFRASTGPGGAVPSDPRGVISGIIQDITDLKRTETALARSRTLQRLAGEVAQVGGWRYEVGTRVLSGTPELQALLRMDGAFGSIEETIGRFEDADRARIDRSFWACVETGAGFDEVAQFRRYDGEMVWIRLIGEAQRDAGGEIISVQGAAQDVGELVLARQSSAESARLLQTMLDSLSDGFVLLDRDGTVRYINDRARSVLGAPATQEMVGHGIRELLPEAVGVPFRRVMAQACETGESGTHEMHFEPSDRWVELSVHPTPVGVAAYVRDVTDERERHERLRLLDIAVSRLNDIVLIAEADPTDPPGPRIVFVNDAFTRMTGYTREEVIGRTPRMLQGPQTDRESLDRMREALTEQRHVRTELVNYRKDGSPYTIELDLNPVFDATGACTHFVSVQRDITERRRTESQLRARQEQLRLVSQASNDVIWDWDVASETLWNSDNYEEVFGRAPAGREHMEAALERIHPDDRERVTRSLHAALDSDQQVWRCEYRVAAEDGSYRTISDRGFILREEDGSPRRMVGAMSDVSELRHLDAQLHHAKKLESVGQLTGGIAHDFNNLLTIILGNCDILLDEAGEDAALAASIRSIEDAAERGARIATDLLAYARRQPLEPRATDINELIRRSSSLFGRAVEASVDVQYDLTDAPAIAFIDPDKLQMALLNLVLNAQAAIEGEGRIVIATRNFSVAEDDASAVCEPGDYIEIVVSDTGIGMAPDVADRAFEPFFTTKEPGVGTGLGLSSVYGLVRQSNGYVTLESEPGEGTTVTICLPPAEDAAGEPASQTPASRPNGGGQRLLVVEDDAEVRRFMQTALGKMGYSVAEAESGESALETLRRDGAFDLLLSDVVMPGSVSGVQLARQAREMHPGLRILLVSGYAREALPNDDATRDDIPVLYKPFRSIDLAERVQDILAGDPPGA